MSGVYSSSSGAGSVEAAKLAVDDFDPNRNGMRVEVISADHQNKPDIASTIAKRWFDTERVDAIFDLPSSAVANAVAEVGASKNKAIMLSGGVGEFLTTSGCRPTTVQWTIDTYAMAKAPADAVVKDGGTSWFYIAGDFNAAKALARDNAAAVSAAGGTVVGSVFSPLDTQDFSSFLMQAQASKAKVIGLSITGGDLVRAVKQANEFGLPAGGQRLVPLIAMINEIHAIGPQHAQGARLVTPFYWDRDDRSRAFARRFAERRNGAVPNEIHAGVYTAVLQYLKAVKELGSPADGKRVVEHLKSREIDDPLLGKFRVAANGRALNEVMLVEVKKPAEVKRPWDYFRILSVLPGEQMYRPLKDTGCNLASASQGK